MIQKSNKGLKTEEVLRNYFISMGYYVVRGIEFKYLDSTITDVDLWLYNKSSALGRERINVDIKDRKSPKAAERLVWAKGMQTIMGFDSCIVVTTNNQISLREFGQEYGVTIIDGNFLSKIKERDPLDRLSEEDFRKLMSPTPYPKGLDNWYSRISRSRNRLLNEMDFSGFNATLDDIKFFCELAITETQNKQSAIRSLYLVISYLLIILDYIQIRMLFVEDNKKKEFLDNGFKYGELGKQGMESYINIATQIASNYEQRKNIEKNLFSEYDRIPSDILSDYFHKSDILKNLLKTAKEFEKLAYNQTFVSPNALERELLSTILVLFDYFGIDRRQLPSEVTVVA